jgi:hypothetical protein
VHSRVVDASSRPTSPRRCIQESGESNCPCLLDGLEETNMLCNCKAAWNTHPDARETALYRDILKEISCVVL